MVRDGVVSYSTAGRTRTLGPGALLLGNPDQEYRLAHDYGQGDDCTVVEYDATLIAGASAPFPSFPVASLPPTPRLEKHTACC